MTHDDTKDCNSSEGYLMSPSAEPYSENDTRLLHLFKFSPCSVSNFTKYMAKLKEYVFASKSILTHWRMQDFDWDELTIPRGSSLHGVLGGRGCLDVGSKFYLLISQTLMVPTFRGGGVSAKSLGARFSTVGAKFYVWAKPYNEE